MAGVDRTLGYIPAMHIGQDIGEDLGDLRERALAALCEEQYADIVDLVVWVEDQITYAANSVGRVRWAEAGREVVSGDDPIGSEDPMAFLPYTEELANPSPARSTVSARAAERETWASMCPASDAGTRSARWRARSRCSRTT